jgi:ATP-binding cassette subfamily F protein 3
VIQLSDLTKSFGDRTLLDHVTWQIGDGDRVGLCGPNGAGKTTLLKMLAGLDEPDSGAIVTPSTLTIGYLPQDGLEHTGRTVFEEASSAFQPLLDVKTEMHDIEHRLADASVPEGEHGAMLARYAELQDRFRLDEGYSMDLRIATVLRGLGFDAEDAVRPCETFSGGWQMRIALAKLLLGRPNLLLLDEPTNHLDLDARNWLEEYLGDYPYAVILVSHDRYFLDAVVTRITDVHLRKLTDYVGNYSKYVLQRDAMLERLRTAKREQDEEVGRIEMFINRFRYQATKAAQVQSRIKMLEKVVPIEVPPERKRIHFTFPACAKSGRTVIELKHVRKVYPPTPGFAGHALTVFSDLSLHIERGDRIALVGPNGAGKSTLMRMLSGEEQPDTGTRTLGHQVVMEYFAQDEAARLDPTLTVYETLSSGSPQNMVPAIRNILGGFLFSGDDVFKKAGVLSGGERTRLAVARMLLRPSNTLLMDEPTNHLDLDSKDVLLDALEDYGGTLILVSHDRYFVEKLATKIIEIGHGGGVVYPGTYAEFLWSKENKDKAPGPVLKAQPGTAQGSGPKAHSGKAQGTAAKALPDGRRGGPSGPPAAGSGPPAAGSSPPATGPSGRDDRKRLEAERKKKQREADSLQKRIADLEGRIAAKEEEVRTLEAAISAPGFYDNRETAKQVTDRHQALMWEVGDLMAQWEAMQQHSTSSR